MSCFKEDMEFLAKVALLCILGIMVVISALFAVGFVPGAICRLIAFGWHAGWTIL